MTDGKIRFIAAILATTSADELMDKRNEIEDTIIAVNEMSGDNLTMLDVIDILGFYLYPEEYFVADDEKIAEMPEVFSQTHLTKNLSLVVDNT